MTVSSTPIPQDAENGVACPTDPSISRGSGLGTVEAPGKSLKISITVNAAWNIWNFRLPVIADLLQQGHSVTVYAPEDEFVAPLRKLGCSFEPLVMNSKGMNPIEDLRLIRRMRRHFAKSRPDIILSYTPKNNIYGALAAQPLGIPFIPNVSGLGTAFLAGSAIRKVAEHLYRRAFRDLETVFFQNADDLDLFVQQGLSREEQAQLLPGSGIDLERFDPRPFPPAGAGITFLMVGRLLRDKGVLEFVEAARRVRQVYPRCRFQLLGAVDSQNRTAISEATVSGWVSSGAIEYLGTSDDVRQQMAEAHCIVLPSYREGAPRTLIEAAALGRPLIATDVPGCRSVVDNGESGLLCDVKSAASLAEACLNFIDLPREKQIEMGKRGRAKMEREFDQGLVVEAYRAAIERNRRPQSVSFGDAEQ